MMATPASGMGYSSQSSQPNYEAAMNKIRHLSKDELQELLNDDHAFERFIQGLEQVRPG